MFNQSETAAIIAILFIALAILGWGYNRAQVYGKLGVLAWLQSVVIIAPWLIFFSLFAAGIYLNFAGILFLLLGSIVIYIFLGKRLRESGQDQLLKEKAAARIEKITHEEPAIPAADIPNPTSGIIPETDLQSIKGIFGIDTFFATETIAYQEGVIFRGNLREDPEIAYSRLQSKLKDSVGEKYRLFLVENPEEKPVVIVLPSSCDPQPMTLAQKNLAIVLIVATVFTTMETSGLLLGFDFFSDWSRYGEALPLSLGLLTILFLHELGHWFAAKQYQIKLSWPFCLPSLQIGTFGAITRFESLLPNRKVLFDISLAGPAVGGIASLIILVVGLFLSTSSNSLSIPSQFFQGSILVGTLAKVILGSSMKDTVINVHPITLIGWLGLVITALNLLPAGQLDGGRMIQAIYGRKTARRTTIATLIILGVVAIANPGNPIILYWAILILFLQRQLERPSLNELTEIDDTRAAWGLLALFLMLATLIPLSPGLAGRLGIGG